MLRLNMIIFRRMASTDVTVVSAVLIRRWFLATIGGGAAVLAVVGCLCAHVGLAQSPSAAHPADFEVASIKRNLSGDLPIRVGPITGGTFRAANIPLQELITMAYRIRDFQLSGAPSWLRSERYDIEGKSGAKAGPDELTAMLKPLLQSRLNLKFHFETKELPVYSLEVTKPGRLIEAEGACGPTPDGLPDPAKLPNGPCGFLFILPGHVMGQKVAISRFVEALSRLTDRVVLDHTGLSGKYDVSLAYPSPGIAAPGPPDGMPPLPPVDPNGPSLFTALQEQLGLKLESRKGRAEIIVIDHVERPSAN